MDLSDLLGGIEKELKGAARVINLDTVETSFEERRPTGIPRLDIALKGGMPGGCVNQIFGPEGVGKDFLTNRMMAVNQQIHGPKSNIFWLSFGYRPDLAFMRLAGVKVRFSDQELLLQGIDPATATVEQRGEQIGNLVFIDVGGTKEAAKQPSEYLLTGALRLIESGVFQLGIINELGSGETGDNTKKGLHQSARMATWASLMSDFLRKVFTAVRRPLDDGTLNSTCMMLINPVRANLNAHTAKYQPYTQGGGHALKHAKVVDLELKPGAKITDKKFRVLGKEVKWRVLKGKHGMHEGEAGSYSYTFEGGIDLVNEVVSIAAEVGIICRGGPYYYIDFGDTRSDKITGGLDGVKELLRSDDSLFARVQELAMSQASSMGISMSGPGDEDEAGDEDEESTEDE